MGAGPLIHIWPGVHRMHLSERYLVSGAERTIALFPTSAPKGMKQHTPTTSLPCLP